MMTGTPACALRELATPASNEHMCDMAAASGADLVFLDLEDACAPAGQGGRPRHRGQRAARARLGSHDAGDPHQRPRHPVVPRRHHRGGHRRPRRAGRDHRAEGPARARRLVGRRAAHPARDQARADPADRAGGAHRGGRGAGERRRDRRGPVRPAGGGHLRAPATSRRRSARGSTATSTPSATTPATSGTSRARRSLAAARAAGIDAIDAPFPDYQDLDGYRRAATHASRWASTGSGRSIPAGPGRPTRSSPRPPTRSRDAPASSRTTARPRPPGGAPSGATACSSTPR